MVNAGKVNGKARYFSPAAFCESFRVFGQIPRFQNPFKYTRKFNVNHETVHPALGRSSLQLPFTPHFQ
jgi:hypothetical protein